MTKKTFFLLLFTLLAKGLIYSQTICAALEAGDDQNVDCNAGSNCVTLNAEISVDQISDGYDTSAYVIYHDYCVPEPEDASATGIVSDDDWTGVIDIGFEFSFFGNTYDKLLIGDNGVVTFDLTDAGGYCPWSFDEQAPDPNLPLNAIFGAYHDLYTPAAPNPGEVISYYLSGTAPFRTFVIDFQQVPQYSCNELLTTQQIVLYETSNIIEVNITEKPVCYSWQDGVALVGIQNKYGTVAYVPGPGTTPDGEDPYPDRNTGAWEITPDTSESWQFVPVGLDAPDYTFTWYDAEGNVLGHDLEITVCPEESTYYKAELIVDDYMPMTDTVNITVPDSFTIGQPADIVQCSTEPGGTTSEFDLSQLDDVILNGNDAAEYTLAYYASEDDAVNDVNPLPSVYTNTDVSETIYAKLTNNDTGCYELVSFNISVAVVSATGITSSGCSTEPGGSEMTVDLEEFTPDITGDQQDVTVTYHISEQDAEAGVNPITEYNGPGTILYSRVENELGCYDVAPVELVLNEAPYIVELPDVLVCNEGYSQGLYDLGQLAEDAAGEQPDVDVTFHMSLDEAMNGEGALENSEVLLDSPATLFIRAEKENGCTSFGSVGLKIENCPPVVPNAFTPNGDGLNDEFTIHRLKTIYQDYKLRIYNRWGTLVYEGGDADPFWDGKVDGTLLGGDDSSGTVYFYVLELNDGEHEPIQGTIYVKP